MIAQLIDFVTVLAVTSDDDGMPTWLLLAGPAGAVATYVGLFRFYRNTDKSHRFEHETTVEAQPVTGSETKVNEVRGTQRRSIEGNNKSTYRQRVQRVQ